MIVSSRGGRGFQRQQGGAEEAGQEGDGDGAGAGLPAALASGEAVEGFAGVRDEGEGEGELLELVGVLPVLEGVKVAPGGAGAGASAAPSGRAGAVCTLRAAIEEANHANNPGLDTINFSITGGGPHTISPGSALPTITDPVIIDGYTQPGASANTNPPGLGSNAVLKIELEGSGAGAGANGLYITAGSSTVKGLVINRFPGKGILLQSNGGNTIQGNYIGTDVTGTADLGNSYQGVYIYEAPSNTVGGTTEAARNVISGNDEDGVLILGSGATGNRVQGNLIGTDKNGTATLGNSSAGVFIFDAPGNTIGGTVAGAGNVISGNLGDGIYILGSGSAGNLVQGNLIGTDVTGIGWRGNGFYGVHIYEAPSNTIGGTTEAARNIISGNWEAGVLISGTGSTANLVQGNYIGMDVNGTADLGNYLSGVLIYDAPGNTIGGTVAGAGNVISGNGSSHRLVYGVHIKNSTATGNLVQGNLIGTDKNGTADLGNSWSGVYISDAPSNTIGGTAAGAGNVVSGNDRGGVYISGYGATGNQVQGNLIGTDVTGTADLGNSFAGVAIARGSNNTIGGTAAGAGNVISANGYWGVIINQSTATGNQVQGNYIGTDVTGTAALANHYYGVYISDAPSNTIGGAVAGARNVISGNDGDGVYISESSATGNLVQGNYIGTDVTGTAALGNTSDGVVIYDAPDNTIGGTGAGARNVISGNDNTGVYISQNGATGNVVEGNYIGTDAAGIADLGNSGSGVWIRSAPRNTIGGTADGAGNVISGNWSGIDIWDGTATGNLVQGNYIGTNKNGTANLGNSYSGVDIIGAPGNTIGGTSEGEGNTIAHNTGDGVAVAVATGNTIRGNSIHSNGGLGIDNYNGGNTELTPPVVTASGSASGTACADCEVDIFSDDADEGRIYHGSATADGAGNWSFPGAVVGPNVTATATDASGNTSEFSPPFACADTDGDGFDDCVEGYLGTDPNAACADSPTADDEGPPDAWPFDFNDDQRASLGDALRYIPVFNTFAPGPPYDQRFDLNGDGGIGLGDVLKYIPVINKTCTP